jgi:iron-sulfur cluster insertion protein
MLHLSPKAIAHLQNLILEQGEPDLLFRVYITGGGCSGFQYGFSFDKELKPDDMLFENESVRMVVDPLSFTYLEGATVDHISNLQGARFLVVNPNAESTCGCGSSFSV